jgi:hypothetical protein
LENSNGKKTELLNSLKKKERKEGRKETDRSFKCCIQSNGIFPYKDCSLTKFNHERGLHKAMQVNSDAQSTPR